MSRQLPPELPSQKRKQVKTHARDALGPKAEVEELSRLPLFEKTTASILTQLEDMAESQVLPRDQLLIAPIISPPRDESVWIVISGQLAIGEYDSAMEAAAGKRVKKEIFKETQQTHALFSRGDIFFDQHLIHLPNWALYSITETRVLKMPERLFRQVLARDAKTLSRIDAHMKRFAEATIAISEDPTRAELFDFYMKNGLSFSTRTKIRQLELCIDCDKCVQACEERHGMTRLERFGPEVGLISFSISCRQCYDPRCLIECNFDAIAREPASGEIRIVMDRCTGCAVCVRNCPNDSIFLHRTEDQVDPAIWTSQEKRVPKKLATKCDRCTGYEDMACITACPTGSMIDADPMDIFHLLENAQAEPMSQVDFEHGLTERKERIPFERASYFVTLCIFFGIALEWAARRFFETTFWVPNTHGQSRLLMTATEGFGYWLGLCGAICMGSTIVYMLRKRVKSLSRLGPLKLYYLAHNALGSLGLGLVFMHGGLHFSRWPALGLIAGFIAIASGLVGAYIQSQLPGVEYAQKQRKQAMNAVLHELSAEWGEHTRSANLADILLTLDKEKERERLGRTSGFKLLIELVQDDLHDRLAFFRLKQTRLKQIKNVLLRKRAEDAYRAQQSVRRQDRYFTALSPLVRTWRAAHIFFVIGLYLVGLTHILAVWLS